DVDWCIRVMKEGERQQLLLRNIHAVVANYVREGQTTLHHKESLRERFDVMCKHYGLVQTVFLHAWFAVRSLIK
ncbi:MAG: glycosyltransferase, partial [Prevotella sp.]|nr:glycosyltransferase [Prevotella sp.]